MWCNTISFLCSLLAALRWACRAPALCACLLSRRCCQCRKAPPLPPPAVPPATARCSLQICYAESHVKQPWCSCSSCGVAGMQRKACVLAAASAACSCRLWSRQQQLPPAASRLVPCTGYGCAPPKKAACRFASSPNASATSSSVSTASASRKHLQRALMQGSDDHPILTPSCTTETLHSSSSFTLRRLSSLPEQPCRQSSEQSVPGRTGNAASHSPLLPAAATDLTLWDGLFCKTTKVRALRGHAWSRQLAAGRCRRSAGAPSSSMCTQSRL